jgi:16S rRNA (guanine527-N7)-methyltransferase
VQPQEGALDRPRVPLPTRVDGLPPLPDEFAAVLAAGVAALGIGVPDDAGPAIDAHVRLLLAWTAAINLTAIRDPVDVARLHVLDSLAAVPHLRARGLTRVLDLGSGGGFPGIPLAVALGTDRALLVDSVGKKVQFLRTVIAAAGLERRVAVEPERAEVVARDRRDREAWPVVTARAVTSLAELVEIGLPLVAPGGVLVAWKRGAVDAEVDGAAGALRALRAGRPQVVDAGVPGLDGHCLIIVPRAGPIDVRFPRDPAERRHRPL